ncbi:MAG: succinyl-diaminopimelate desuccinylase [Betaproteobacteria bacterium]|jgi:succinyl-diaminopimelate desuccinylase|nr:succinyl-diaminopimelate desuccinylase [Nitrosomonadales bacterium]NCV37724.1 succinyl-diaminopimelate desuccinylase [Betaproteobacteria bacterium]NCV53206.1 succinyl-diaminopimelate desuccinylase [Betaproteobacteria bacterium]NCW62621.1 succinyl-diaminopimelate desuccinylase [Betaproteobacteria bacterium]NCX67553.1 succinyl-diaminopimelate desuccinylase [Betaproteobacteria bacterium]
MTKTLDIAKRLIEIDSITPNDNGCINIIKSELNNLNFEYQSIDSNGVSNLYAKRGESSPSIIFAGHVDVVPPGPLDKWQSDPFIPTAKDGLLYGRGSADMKSSIAAFIVAINEFTAEFPNHKGSIGLFITSDEEGIATDGTKKIVEHFIHNNQDIDYCIVGEPTSAEKFGDTIKNGRRGSLSATLIVKGIQGHIAYPHLIDNPIHRSASIIDELKKISWDDGNEYFPKTSWQVSNINAGTGATNVVPGDVIIQFNFRHSTECTPDQLKNEVEMIVKKHADEYELNWEIPSEPYLTQKGFLTDVLTSAISDITGITPKVSTTGGTSDGRFIAKICKQVVEFGPINASIHKINEHVNIDDIEKLKEIYKLSLIKILCS